MGFLDWFAPRAPLPAGETEVWSALANHSVSPDRALGGRLRATEHRLIFEPNRVDRGLGGQTWSVPLGAIAAVGVEPRTGRLFDGGLRDRLRVVTADGAAHRFVVNKLPRVIAELDALVRRARA